MGVQERTVATSVVDETKQFTRDQLIETYLPLIQTVARSLAARLPACVEVEDLASIGVMGLMDAIQKYDPTKCDSFKNYARIRIKGAMLDELRSLDWVPRSVRQVASRIERQRRVLEQELIAADLVGVGHHLSTHRLGLEGHPVSGPLPLGVLAVHLGREGPVRGELDSEAGGGPGTDEALVSVGRRAQYSEDSEREERHDNPQHIQCMGECSILESKF